jgi:hypothetical protein
MDDIVQQAMAKWPNVPAVYGWLSLSRRGEWRIKGEKIANPIVTDFINRNYMHDEQGRWFFQNGPQRVYVSLDYTPLVYRFAYESKIESHSGLCPHHFHAAYIDDGGSLLLNTELGVGVVDDRDLYQFLSLLTNTLNKPLTQDELEKLAGLAPQHWHGLRINLQNKMLEVGTLPASEAPTRFGFKPQPSPPKGEEECY